VNPPTQHTHTHTHTTLRSICITCLLVGRVCMGVITLWNNCFSPKHTGHNYWLPVIKYFLPSPFAKTTVLSFFYNARWVWRTDQRSFLHTESLQILQIHKFMVVFLLSSSLHSSSVGFRSEEMEIVWFPIHITKQLFPIKKLGYSCIIRVLF